MAVVDRRKDSVTTLDVVIVLGNNREPENKCEPLRIRREILGNPLDDAVSLRVLLVRHQKLVKADQAFIVDLIVRESLSVIISRFVGGLFHHLDLTEIK